MYYLKMTKNKADNSVIYYFIYFVLLIPEISSVQVFILD
jgi:hypothetical protein